MRRCAVNSCDGDQHQYCHLCYQGRLASDHMGFWGPAHPMWINLQNLNARTWFEMHVCSVGALYRVSQKWFYTHAYILPVVRAIDPAERSLESYWTREYVCFYRLSIEGVVCPLCEFAQLFWVNLCISHVSAKKTYVDYFSIVADDFLFFSYPRAPLIHYYLPKAPKNLTPLML